jgi:hypothetical protein
MAGSSMDDYDVFEDGFARLIKAEVICCDYALVKKDFPQLANASEGQIDAWLIQNSAFISEG